MNNYIHELKQGDPGGAGKQEFGYAMSSAGFSCMWHGKLCGGLFVVVTAQGYPLPREDKNVQEGIPTF